jgi:ubiquinone/menaquinone biosynthesis C-methylase UbiE
MSERTGGARRVLSNPRVYELLQRALGSRSSRVAFVEQHLRPKPGDRILDVGCGPGDLLDVLPEVEYTGIDLSQSYIDSARDRHGDRGEFHRADARTTSFPDASFEIVSVVALLHHLDDEGVTSVFRLASRALVASGRLVTLDNATRHGQHPVARWLIMRDRGIFVRTTDQYAQLARPFFETVRATTREDLLRVPYTHAILECSGPRSGG